MADVQYSTTIFVNQKGEKDYAWSLFCLDHLWNQFLFRSFTAAVYSHLQNPRGTALGAGRPLVKLGLTRGGAKAVLPFSAPNIIQQFHLTRIVHQIQPTAILLSYEEIGAVSE